MIKGFHPFVLIAMLAACVPTSGTEPIPRQPVDPAPGLNDPQPDVCNSAPYRRLIGQPAAAVARAGITQPTRVIPLGGLVTEDYSSSRINFYLDGAGNIATITCG